MKKYFLEIVVFICGAVVMAYQIIGSRMLGPYVGTSMMVWSSIIGVMLLSLSHGYYYGGRFADKKPEHKKLALIIGISALFIIASTFLKNNIFSILLGITTNVKVVSVLASILLFSIPAFGLGMVSPFAARLKMKDVKTSGATVGGLYALSTLGSITGTFLAGFYFIPSFRITTILFILALILILASIGLYFVYESKNQLTIQND